MVRNRWKFWRIALADRIKLFEPGNCDIRPIVVEMQVTLGGSGAVCQRQVNILNAVQPARPPLCCPCVVQFSGGSVLLLQPSDESLPVHCGIRHESVSDFIVLADCIDSWMMWIASRHRICQDGYFACIIRVASVVHIAFRGWMSRSILASAC